MQVLVCVPTTGSIDALTTAAIFRICAAFPGPISFQTFVAEPRDHARNLGARCLLGGTGTHLLLVDPDVIPPDDALLRLLAADAPVAAGLHPITPPGGGLRLSAAHVVGDDPTRVRWIDAPARTAEEHDVVGLGCTLIRRDVIEALDGQKAPIFGSEVREDGDLIGADVAFSRRLRESIGIRPLVVPEVLCDRHAAAGLGGLWLHGRRSAVAPDHDLGSTSAGTTNPAANAPTAAPERTPLVTVLPPTGRRGPSTVVPAGNDTAAGQGRDSDRPTVEVG